MSAPEEIDLPRSRREPGRRTPCWLVRGAGGAFRADDVLPAARSRRANPGGRTAVSHDSGTGQRSQAICRTGNLSQTWSL